MLWKEISAGTEGESTHKGPHACARKGCPRLRPCRERETPTQGDGWATPPTAQGGSATTNQDAVHSLGCTPPTEPGVARARGEWARKGDGPSATGVGISPALRDARMVPTTGSGGSGAEVGSHDGTDGTGNATSTRLLRPHQMWSVIKCGYVGAEDLPTG